MRVLRNVARVAGAVGRAPLRFVNWVYRRRPFEPESALRRTIDSQAGTRSPVYQIGMQEVYRSENELRKASDARDGENRPREKP
jgi:hypothetical protein